MPHKCNCIGKGRHGFQQNKVNPRKKKVDPLRKMGTPMKRNGFTHFIFRVYPFPHKGLPIFFYEFTFSNLKNMGFILRFQIT